MKGRLKESSGIKGEGGLKGSDERKGWQEEANGICGWRE